MFDYNLTYTWPVRIEFPNVPLVPVNKISLPVLYIKLGLFQKYVKALEKRTIVLNLSAEILRNQKLSYEMMFSLVLKLDILCHSKISLEP